MARHPLLTTEQEFALVDYLEDLDSRARWCSIDGDAIIVCHPDRQPVIISREGRISSVEFTPTHEMLGISEP